MPLPAARPGNRAKAAAISAALLLSATACTVAGGGGGPADYGLRPVAEPSPVAPGADDLDRVALPAGSVHAQAIDGRSPAGGVSAEARCRPIADALTGGAPGHPIETSLRQAVGQGAQTHIALAAYKGGGAETAMADLGMSADACSQGFTLSLNGTKQQVESVSRALAPAGADQAMAFDFSVVREGTPTPSQVIVLRKGTTVAVFSATPSPSSGQAPDAFAVPADLVGAQLLRLG